MNIQTRQQDRINFLTTLLPPGFVAHRSQSPGTMLPLRRLARRQNRLQQSVFHPTVWSVTSKLLCTFYFMAVLARVTDGAAGSAVGIRGTDEQSGRGVPLVELRTVNNVAWWTDSAGLVAFEEPGVMGEEVFFHVNSPGYEYPKDFFENRGLKLRVV